MPNVEGDAAVPQGAGFWRWVLRTMSCLLLFLLFLYIKVVYHARQEFALAEAAFTDSAYTLALTHYERTIKWYTPGSPVVQQAVARLWQCGTEAEGRGDMRLALAAYQTLRSSLYAVQSFYIPYQSWIPLSEARIAPLLAHVKAGDTPQGEQLAQDTARFTMQFQRHVGPHVGWSILVELGFLGWVGAAIGLIWYMMDAQGRFVRRRSLLWGSSMVGFLALWVISMRFA